jgi:hypothetical protein
MYINGKAVPTINEPLRSTAAMTTPLCYIQAGFCLSDTLAFHLSHFVALLYRHSILRITAVLKIHVYTNHHR